MEKYKQRFFGTVTNLPIKLQSTLPSKPLKPATVTAVSGKLLTKDLDPGIYFFLTRRYNCFSKG